MASALQLLTTYLQILSLSPKLSRLREHFPEELFPTLKIIRRDSEVLAADQTAVLGSVEGKPSVRSQQSGVSNGM